VPISYKPAILPLFLLLSACRSGPEPTEIYWPGEDQRVPLDSPFLAGLGIDTLSTYAQSVQGPVDERPDAGHRGAYAVGNGRAFALSGLTDPMNTLHSPVGPRYDREARFFGDLSLVIERDGQRVDFEREWISQVRGAPVTVTRGDIGDTSLYTVDLAPIPSQGEPPPGILRWVVFESDTPNTRVCLDSFSEPSDEQGVPVFIQTSERSLALGGAWIQTAGGWCLEGGTQPLYLSFGDSPQAALDGLVDDPALLMDWTEQTLDHWADFQAQGVQLRLPDPRIEDFYTGLRASIRVQQTAAGGISPMSRYTEVWLRDTIGPVRFFTRAGIPGPAREMLDYLYLCHIYRGDIGNACSSALTYEDVPPAPDWANLPPLSGREKAEGPSYIPLSWTTWARWTGDWSPIEEHWDYLSRALLAQQMDEQGRQGWSGDETFRLAMNVAFGLGADEPWPEQAWSSNSSLLMAAAGDSMAEAAQQLGLDSTPFEERAGLARQALSGSFLQPEGHLAAVRYFDDRTEPRPFEDAMLKMLWVPAYEVEDPTVLRAFDSLRAQVLPVPGALQSPLDPLYQDNPLLGAQEGYATGMAPGYALFTLNQLGALDSEAAFNLVPHYADTAGQSSEGVIWDDGSAVQPSYDPGGLVGDFAARYRPWEGGVVGDAMLSYLVGTEPTANGLALRPHLPNGLPWMEVEQITVRDTVVDLRLDQDAKSLLLTLTARTPARVELELPIPTWMGEVEVRHEGEERVLPGGERLVRFEPIELQAGEVWTTRLRPRSK